MFRIFYQEKKIHKVIYFFANAQGDLFIRYGFIEYWYIRNYLDRRALDKKTTGYIVRINKEKKVLILYIHVGSFFFF